MSGAWQPLADQPTFNASTMLLLTDGTIMAQDEGTNRWWGLLADDTGDYVAGTWNQLTSSVHSREYYASAVLDDGRVLVAGGEYSDVGGEADAAEIYDPVLDQWTSISTPGWGWIGDASCCLLADGRFLMGSIRDARTALYNHTTNVWIAGANKADPSSEETWTLLPDGTVLTAECSNFPAAEKYVPSSGTWVTAGSTPVDLVQASSIEIGPAVLLPDGRCFCIGATGHSALYTPSADPNQPGEWAIGPDLPADSQGRLMKAKDAPACLLPNGRVLLTAGPAGDSFNDWPNPTHFFEFDPVTDTVAPVPDPPNNNTFVFEGRMMLLPTGQVLYVAGTPAAYVYTPDGKPNLAWRPQILGLPTRLWPGAAATLRGRQLNGLSQAVSYGDDAAQATNYPLVTLKSKADGTVVYCRTYHHSTMAVATGKAIVSTRFEVPEDIGPGRYMLCVIANGISSKCIPVRVHIGRFGPTMRTIDTDEPTRLQVGTRKGKRRPK